MITNKKIALKISFPLLLLLLLLLLLYLSESELQRHQISN